MKKTYLFLSLVIFSLVACYPTSNNVYQAESTKGVNFKNYKTYAWLPTKEDTSYIKLADKKVVESALAKAVSQQLTEHGMTMDTVNPDCLFTYSLVLKKTYQVGDNPPPGAMIDYYFKTAARPVQYVLLVSGNNPELRSEPIYRRSAGSDIPGRSPAD